jgi:hypothetical protein
VCSQQMREEDGALLSVEEKWIKIPMIFLEFA